MTKNVLKLFRDLMKLGKVETEQGVLIYEGDELIEGTEVFIEDEGGNIVSAPDGVYGEYTVKDGKIAPKEEAPAPETEAPAPETEAPKDEEPKSDPMEDRIKALEDQVAELKGILDDLKAQKDDMEFSSLKPAEKAVKDIANPKSKGAMKYFEIK